MREHVSEFFDEHHIDAAAIALFVMQQQFGGSFGTVGRIVCFQALLTKQ